MKNIIVSNPFVQSLRSDRSFRLTLDLDDPNQIATVMRFVQESNGSYFLKLEPADYDDIPYIGDLATSHPDEL